MERRGRDGSNDVPDWLDPEAAAAYAGVSLWTVRRWIEHRLLPFAQPSGPTGRIRIAKSDVDAFLRAATVPASAGPLARTPR